MKKLYKYIGLSFLGILLQSCNKMLELEPHDKLTSSVFWRDLADAEAGVSAAYSQLENRTGTWDFAEIKWPVEAYREDVVILGADANNYPNWVELSRFTYTDGNSQVNYYWSNNYTGINFCNQVIEQVPLIPSDKILPSDQEMIVAEARFLRAYYHLKLILNFEEIPIRKIYIKNQNELSEPLSSRKDVWEFIVNDLTFAASKLPVKHTENNVGRATSGAANAYLGFAYLTMSYEQHEKNKEYLEKALSAFDKVQGYKLEKDFLSMFTGHNKNCEESIFEVQFSMSTANGANHNNQLHFWMAASELGGWDEILPSDFLIQTFKKEGKISTLGLYDSRLYATCYFNDPYFNDGTGKVLGKDYKERFSDSMGKAVFRKYLPETEEEMSQSRTAINIPLMRYANVLLMKAEVLNELNRGNEALPLINEVRKVHGDMPPITYSSKDNLRLQIEHERIIEFPLENWRWYDLRRWGKLNEAMNAAGRSSFTSKHSFYPIPLVEKNANSAIKQ